MILQRPKPSDWETAWTKWLAQEIGGESEVLLADGSRADIVTDTQAIEVEWIKKWKEAPAQALLYSALTNLDPVVLLLTRGKPSEPKFLLRCLTVCRMAGVRLETYRTL